jgi:hypothetical protein
MTLRASDGMAVVLALALAVLGEACTSTKSDREVTPGTTANPGQKTPEFLTTSLDLNIANVGPQFMGHDIAAITERLESALHPKEEFESSQEYEKRKAALS